MNLSHTHHKKMVVWFLLFSIAEPGPPNDKCKHLWKCSYQSGNNHITYVQIEIYEMCSKCVVRILISMKIFNLDPKHSANLPMTVVNYSRLLPIYSMSAPTENRLARVNRKKRSFHLELMINAIKPIISIDRANYQNIFWQ